MHKSKTYHVFPTRPCLKLIEPKIAPFDPPTPNVAKNQTSRRSANRLRSYGHFCISNFGCQPTLGDEKLEWWAYHTAKEFRYVQRFDTIHTRMWQTGRRDCRDIGPAYTRYSIMLSHVKTNHTWLHGVQVELLGQYWEWTSVKTWSCFLAVDNEVRRLECFDRLLKSWSVNLGFTSSSSNSADWHLNNQRSERSCTLNSTPHINYCT